MTDNGYKEMADKILEEYYRVSKIPVVKNNIYLGMNSKSHRLIIEWNNDFSLLEFMYRNEYLFYGKIDTWVGVEMFTVNNPDIKVEVFKKAA